MPINVDLTETQNPASVGEYQRVAPGPVHLMVLEANENGGKNNEHVVKFEVLMHADKNQVGLTHTEYFPADAKMAWKLLGFCYATKIADREQMQRQKESGNQYVPIELSAAVGRQLFGTIKVTEKDGKAFHNLDNMLSIDDPKAEKHPRHVGMLQQALSAIGNGAASVGQQTQVHRATTATVAPAAVAAADPFAALT